MKICDAVMNMCVSHTDQQFLQFQLHRDRDSNSKREIYIFIDLNIGTIITYTTITKYIQHLLVLQ